MDGLILRRLGFSVHPLRYLRTGFDELRANGKILAKSDTLDIVVRDIDMAGAYEPWRAPYLSNTRIMRDVYPPRITLHYLWRDGSGAVLADKQEILSDLNYLTLLDSRQYLPNDPLRYEKAMLERWFAQTFAPRQKP
jgi:hypothetical protein